MKLQMISGCIVNSLTVNDKEEVDMTTNERLEVTRSIMQWLLLHPKENDHFLNYLIQDFIREFGEMYEDGPCACCGDYIDTFELEI